MVQEKKIVRACLLNCDEVTNGDLSALFDVMLEKDSTVTRIECIGDARVEDMLLSMKSAEDITDTIKTITKYMKKMKTSCIFCNYHLPAPIMRYMTASAVIYGQCGKTDDMLPVYEMWNGKAYQVGWFQG